ncbi:MAG: hypothetical protein OK457_00205 [Thaumarchaeota archaeon]|nr:hypothetical protein [Nitrososphaerota archaeon]
MKGVYGAKAFAKKRIHPHPSKRKLHLVERTQNLFPHNAPFFTDPREAMKESRKEAFRQLKTEKNVTRKKSMRRSDNSRRINAGLTVFIPEWGVPSKPKAATIAKRREKQAARTKANESQQR